MLHKAVSLFDLVFKLIQNLKRDSLIREDTISSTINQPNAWFTFPIRDMKKKIEPTSYYNVTL